MRRIVFLSLMFSLSLFATGCSNTNSSDTQPQDAIPSELLTDGSALDNDSETTVRDGMIEQNDASVPDVGAGDTGVTDDGEPNYANPAHWLCHPDRDDGPCHENLDVTQINADGSLEIIPHEKAVSPAFDCFYVYPTCSLDSAPNSDLDAEEEEAIVHLQAARFQSQCRVFAPIYRQITIGGLVSQRDQADADMAYNDVLNAFEYYLQNHNDGRGIVLIGHSQGTGMLTRLVQDRFDDSPQLRDQLISAYLIGLTIDVPEGAVVGGSFQNTPLCSQGDEIGCVVTYASYRALQPPEPGAVFGISQNAGMEAGCNSPNELLGEMNGLHSIFPSEVPSSYANLIIGNVSPFADPASAPSIETGFSVPGLVSGQCIRRGDYHYLSIEVNADPDDPRADDVGGDLVLPGWGLHLVDVNLALGQLEALMSRQSATYADR